MNHRFSRSLLFATGLLLSTTPVPAAPAASPARVPDRFEHTKEHIDTLLKQRLKPLPLPTVLPNPFQSSGGVTGPGANPEQSPTTPPEPEKPLTADDEILAFYAATLKITGQMMVNGLPHLIINSSPYKEGSLIQVHGKGDAIYYLRIVRIAPNELTLGYNAAQLTLPVK
ncbi:MAG TPA: hypothetical protein VKC51_03940 [Lacunisphaera sp.]|nr:hypothetical protein [Lacunisphaera sp.]